jgi:ribosomal protein L16 Arg81 hydroxylase
MPICRFLESFNFASLIAPTTPSDFRRSYWERKPLIIQRENPEYYGDLFSVQDFDDAVMRSPSAFKMVDASSKGTTINSATVAGFETLVADMRCGGSVILEQLHRRDPKLGLFCRLLGQELGHTFETNLFLTPPFGRSSVPHWDNTDTFILQLRGSKQWQIERARRTFPIRPERMRSDEPREFTGAYDTFNIKQGDFLYIPRGFMHVAQCKAEGSLHISMGLVPVVLEDLLQAIVRAAVRGDERLRVALPLGFMQGGDEEIVDRVMAIFRGVADRSFVNAVLDAYRDELVQASPLDISGQISELVGPSPLTLNDIVGPRRGTVWRMHKVGEDIHVKVGSRDIAFPGYLQEALEFALHQPSFTVRELPAGLQDEEKIPFAERLLQEGLLIRRPRA